MFGTAKLLDELRDRNLKLTEENNRLRERNFLLEQYAEEPDADGCCIGRHCKGCEHGYVSDRLHSKYGCMLAAKKKCEHFKAVST